MGEWLSSRSWRTRARRAPRPTWLIRRHLRIDGWRHLLHKVPGVCEDPGSSGARCRPPQRAVEEELGWTCRGPWPAGSGERWERPDLVVLGGRGARPTTWIGHRSSPG
ncbi:hypothetical protein NDU88_007428 [Pleurodeles waltl]|uniref:Uncharacterized protein n=1 Tax=Pleurodeles waltl TaxID=8319 RepID=A0AAV7PL90_PLEWA|nr:hypothetical protein NDU88_007428 [Pleurodeles waltl]